MPTTYAIPDGRTVMAATTYTGTGSSLAVSNAVNGVSFQPDLVWIKARSNAYNHELYDSVRGVQKRLLSNLTNAESTSTLALTAFNSNGFTQGGETETGANGATYVAWNWKAGTTSASNTNGTITSTVSVGATQGFSVATYTGNGSSATIGHGLGVAPSMYIVKRRDGASNWSTWHIGLSGGTYYVSLDSTAAQASNTVVFPGATPTSTVFSVGTSICGNGSTYVAYAFAAVAGYSAFGSYTGNGSADGPFVYTGFRPRYVLTKRTNSTGGWVILDSSRDTYNVSGNILQAESADAELSASSYPTLDILSNGFKIRSSTIQNASGGIYIYACFAENPFKYANAR